MQCFLRNDRVLIGPTQTSCASTFDNSVGAIIVNTADAHFPRTAVDTACKINANRTLFSVVSSAYARISNNIELARTQS